ncbi:hypothetical protein KUD11_09365 [Roseovarius sp. LXJ103]|uniref:SH3 domain-containing protein n=1 Tax=Roseovarius carneus TaxID=2853164 RepID=UPI000D69E26E|nr:SH3 domain-containing protein [Roseovarius carneus]MBZ8118857.1 hypothetical protein [Roseovarius carneus]
MRWWALALALSGGPVAAQMMDGHGPDAWAVTGVAADDRLNLRAGPGTQYAQLGSLGPDARGIEMMVCVPTLNFEQFQTLEAEGHVFQPRWCLVRLEGESGWARARYLREDG